MTPPTKNKAATKRIDKSQQRLTQFMPSVTAVPTTEVREKSSTESPNTTTVSKSPGSVEQNPPKESNQSAPAPPKPFPPPPLTRLSSPGHNEGSGVGNERPEGSENLNSSAGVDPPDDESTPSVKLGRMTPPDCTTGFQTAEDRMVDVDLAAESLTPPLKSPPKIRNPYVSKNKPSYSQRFQELFPASTTKPIEVEDVTEEEDTEDEDGSDMSVDSGVTLGTKNTSPATDADLKARMAFLADSDDDDTIASKEQGAGGDTGSISSLEDSVRTTDTFTDKFLAAKRALDAAKQTANGPDDDSAAGGASVATRLTTAEAIDRAAANRRKSSAGTGEDQSLGTDSRATTDSLLANLAETRRRLQAAAAASQQNGENQGDGSTVTDDNSTLTLDTAEGPSFCDSAGNPLSITFFNVSIPVEEFSGRPGPWIADKLAELLMVLQTIDPMLLFLRCSDRTYDSNRLSTADVWKPDDAFDLQYFKQFVHTIPNVTSASKFPAFVRILVMHKMHYRDLVSSYAQEDSRTRLFKAPTQCSHSTQIGWLLYSHKNVDSEALQEALTDLTDFPVGLRWKPGEGKSFDDDIYAPHYAAYYVECSLRGHDIVRDRMAQIFPNDTSPRPGRQYPLGLRLVFVPKEQGLPSLADAKELVMIWMQQEQFVKNLGHYTTTHMLHSLDKEVDDREGPTLRELIMSIPAPRSHDEEFIYPLFHSVRLYQKEGDTWITQFTYNMHHRDRAKHVANNLLSFLRQVCEDDLIPLVEQYFAPWAIEKADKAVFNAVKGTVISAPSQSLRSVLSGNSDPRIDMIVHASANSARYSKAMKNADPSESAADLLKRCREAQQSVTPEDTTPPEKTSTKGKPKKRKDGEKQADGTPSRGMHTRKKSLAGRGKEAGRRK